MSKKVRVINNKDRYFNGARKGQVLEIDSEMVSYYEKNGFSVIGNVISKENIVKDKQEDGRTTKELKEILDHHGVDYKGVSKKEDLLELVKSIETEKTEDETEKNSDLEEIKTQIINEAIETEENLAKLSENEILEIAKNNGLI
ncbi:hypothetical protein DLH72_02195 [Candidatus Gracilibacteria bacterium]|nr:MAG: hypothetical protein DLH72_02195 [Candidatus Gracilibacteria bacterium]